MKLRKKALIIIGGAIASIIALNPIVSFLLSPPQQIPIERSGNDPVFLVLIVNIVFGAAVIFFLEKAVLSRLAKLNTSVSSIGSTGDLSARVSLTGKDELSSLADEINGMLVRLEQAQSELKSLNEKLRVVGELTRHDARNKLSVVVMNVFTVKQMLAGEHEALEHLRQIESACGEIVRIFDFARTYEKLGVEELAYMDVEKTVEETVALLSDLRGVEVVNDCHGLTVLADSLLRQLFYNLIDNSLRHGEKVSRVRVYYEEMGKGQLRLAYEDDGVGIRENMRSNLFKEGYGKNTGYGLYLISKMCEVYGWTIGETGKQGKGVQFTITIPRVNKSGREIYQLH